ncbi:MAG: hypothetical protein GF329_01455 [Candidatus Lokiarchaeota archaeon]|nr:hypothetical protein [Candidatus Lokiarchaeota archaeon]
MQAELILNIICLVIMITIAILSMYLSVLIVAGKYKAGRRIGVSVLLGIIIVLLIPYLSQALEAIPAIPAPPPPDINLFAGLAPYLAFLILIFLTYWLMDLEWQKALLISFLTILFIVVTNNIIVGINPYGYNPLETPF